MGKKKITEQTLLDNGYVKEGDSYFKDEREYYLMNGFLVDVKTGIIKRNVVS